MSTRRSLAGGAVLALLGAPGASSEEPPAGGTVLPDRELIQLCYQFDVLEHQYRAAVHGMKTFEDEDRAEKVTGRIVELQAPLLVRICTVPCTTSAGLAAIAGSLVLWDGEIDLEDDDPDADTNDRLLAALLRAVLSGRAAA